jgi:hypothetical protein
MISQQFFQNQNNQPKNGGESSDENDEMHEEGDEDVLQCQFPGCFKEFSSRWSLTRHTRTHTGAFRRYYEMK